MSKPYNGKITYSLFVALTPKRTCSQVSSKWKNYSETGNTGVAVFKGNFKVVIFRKNIFI